MSNKGATKCYTHRRLGTRSLKTVFGPIRNCPHGLLPRWRRQHLSSRWGLALPARVFSYEFQRRLVQAAVQGTFQESMDGIADLTGLSVSKRSLEELGRHEDGAVGRFGGAFLIKGVKVSDRGGAPPTVRLTQGQKANRKRMATVFTRAPWVRTPEQVVESLFRIRQIPADEPAAPRPENQRVWASLLKGKTAVIEEVAHEMQRRDPQGIKTRVALTDGERALQILVEGRSASP